MFCIYSLCYTVILFRMWNMFWTFTLVVSELRLFFCISLISRFPCVLLRYFLSDFEMVPVAPVITGITFAFTFHMRWISFIRSLYLKIFSASFLITCLSTEIATSINIHIPFSKSPIMISGLLLGIVLFALIGFIICLSTFATCFDWFCYMVIPVFIV